MHEAWKKDPNSVHVSWKSYFENLENGLGEHSFISPPTIDPRSSVSQSLSSSTGRSSNSDETQESLMIIQLIRAYQKNGYLKATLDPLKIMGDHKNFKLFDNIKDLHHSSFGFKDSDLQKEFTIPYNKIKEGVHKIDGHKMKLGDLINLLEKAYCGNIGIEFKHISNREEVNYIINQMENKWTKHKVDNEEKIDIYKRLIWATKFEYFCDVKFTTKRFGVEGLETLITGMNTFFEDMSSQGVKDITLGMAHRGRLNVLANLFGKPLNNIFKEFMGKTVDNEGFTYWRSGDVKYHLGYSSTKQMKNKNSMKLEILCNPSHLECVNPVVQGKVRAKQHFNNDSTREDYVGVLIHGDAAFCGQGINYENFQMNNLENYRTGGLLHVIANNQIGFTTTPKDGRSTPHSTDIGKAYDSPIIHVNADDPEAVDFAFKMAADYMRLYPKDLIIDIIGYRRHGHNEQDEPKFTQPEMYEKISKHKSVSALYEEKLISEGVDKNLLESIKKEVDDTLNKHFEQAKAEDKIHLQNNEENWQGYSTDVYKPDPMTGVNEETLKGLGEKICTIPNEFQIHPRVKKIYESRMESIKTGRNIDWATGEALAWALLLQEGKTVRLSGQDCERGTFSHRHSVLHDQKNYKTYRPLDVSTNNPKDLQICLSPLSEYAVLGYELGFSYYDPSALVMWEAQFGDFANGAQVIIDQFLASGESKWNMSSGLVLLLPHGMDGMGPEHSSCRIERFLELLEDHPFDFDYKTSDKNIITTSIQVCNPTTPANYFHLLLRQMRRTFRKPLIIPTPKRLLRLKQASSNLSDFSQGKLFEKVRKESNKDILANADKVKLVLLCSGNVYYDLIAEREKLKRNDVAIIALEQIAPMPYLQLVEATKDFKNAHIRWVQEEHLNNGCWTYVQPRINTLLKQIKRTPDLSYAGRNPAAAPATGFKKVHDDELNKLLNDAFKI